MMLCITVGRMYVSGVFGLQGSKSLPVLPVLLFRPAIEPLER